MQLLFVISHNENGENIIIWFFEKNIFFGHLK